MISKRSLCFHSAGIKWYIGETKSSNFLLICFGGVFGFTRWKCFLSGSKSFCSDIVHNGHLHRHKTSTTDRFWLRKMRTRWNTYELQITRRPHTATPTKEEILLQSLFSCYTAASQACPGPGLPRVQHGCLTSAAPCPKQARLAEPHCLKISTSVWQTTLPAALRGHFP